MLKRTMEGVCVVHHIFMNGCMFTSEGVSLHDLCVLVLLCVHALCVHGLFLKMRESKVKQS